MLKWIWLTEAENSCWLNHSHANEWFTTLPLSVIKSNEKELTSMISLQHQNIKCNSLDIMLRILIIMCILFKIHIFFKTKAKAIASWNKVRYILTMPWLHHIWDWYISISYASLIHFAFLFALKDCPILQHILGSVLTDKWLKFACLSHI